MRIRERFNPRAPCGARLLYKLINTENNKFQPTRPLRGATRRLFRTVIWLIISTHAPLAGRDLRP